MSRSARSVAQGVFALGIVASLGFGVRQATAEPAEVAAARACVPDDCNSYCLAQGYLGGGVCTQVGDRQRCLCLYS